MKKLEPGKWPEIYRDYFNSRRTWRINTTKGVWPVAYKTKMEAEDMRLRIGVNEVRERAGKVTEQLEGNQ